MCTLTMMRTSHSYLWLFSLFVSGLFLLERSISLQLMCLYISNIDINIIPHIIRPSGVLIPVKEVMFSVLLVGLFVCLFVGKIYTKSTEINLNETCCPSLYRDSIYISVSLCLPQIPRPTFSIPSIHSPFYLIPLAHPSSHPFILSSLRPSSLLIQFSAYVSKNLGTVWGGGLNQLRWN